FDAANPLTFDGNGGRNTVGFLADYGALLLQWTTFRNIQAFTFGGGHSYTGIVISAGDIMGGSHGSISAGQAMTIDASAASQFAVDLTAARNVHDAIAAFIVAGSDGDDTFKFSDDLLAGDRIGGGAGNDTVELAGHYSDFVLGASTFAGIETLKLD